jgi:lactate racemase
MEPLSSLPVPHSSLLDRVCAYPVALPSLTAYLKNEKKVLFILNDTTRPTPSSLVVQHIINKGPGLEPHFAIATGTHRAPSEKDLQQIIGPLAEDCNSRITVNDCRNAAGFNYIGTTSLGTPVSINNILFEFDRIIVINSIEPHYFAGFTGGRKSIVPGLAAFETIEANHRLALSSHAALMKLEGNPVHEDLTEAVSLLEKKIFAISLVLNRNYEIIDALSGELIAHFPEAAKKAEKMFLSPLQHKYDIVITVARAPLDANLYQAHKVIENVRGAVNEGGIIILVALCNEGMGNDTFARLLELSRDPAFIRDTIEKRYRLGYHKAAKLAEFLESGMVFAVTGMNPELLENISFKAFKSLQEALDKALSTKKGDTSVLVITDGNMVVPVAVDRHRNL